MVWFIFSCLIIFDRPSVVQLAFCVKRVFILLRWMVYVIYLDEWSDESSEEDEPIEADDADDDSTGAVAVSKPKKQHKAVNVAAKRKSHLNIVFIGHVGKCILCY